MPVWVVILIFLGALVCGYLAMDGLDRYLVRQTGETSPVKEAKALVFGQENDTFFARNCLQSANICYDVIDTPILPGNGIYHVLLALSASDVDNLLLCAAARQRYADIITAARLTNTVYLPVFRDAAINHILPDPSESTIMELLNHVHPDA